MKDINTIKEFFSKPLNEESTTFKVGDKVTYLGHPAEITAVNKEMTGAITYNVAYNKGYGRTKATNINRDDIKRLNEANGFKSGKEFINIKLRNYPKAKAKVNQLIDMIGESRFTQEMAEWIFDFFNNASFERPVNEATEESYMISKSGSKSNPHYVLEKPDGSKQIDMMFSSPEEAKKYAAKKNIKVSSKTGYNMNEAKEEDKKITTDQLLNNPKTLVLDKETSIRGIKFQPGDVVSVQYQFDDDNESFYRIKGYGKDEIKINHLTKKEMDNFLKNTLLKISEAKEEDPVDTITMDIPLFLRMLEYAKEDAAEDMDLHDVTEKANLLGKERGILQMEDYDEIVGAAEEIKEVTNYMKLRKKELAEAIFAKLKK